MGKVILLWNVYEISSGQSSLNGVKLRGRIRKLGLERGFNVLAENTEDAPNGVRFAVLEVADARVVEEYLQEIIADVKVDLVLAETPNPVLSKLAVNREARYSL